MKRFLTAAVVAVIPLAATAQTPANLAALAGVTGTSHSAPFAASPGADSPASIAAQAWSGVASVSRTPTARPVIAFAGADLVRLRNVPANVTKVRDFRIASRDAR